MEQSAFGIITTSVTIVVLLANKISETSETLVRYPDPTTRSPHKTRRNKLMVVPIIDETTQARVL